MDGLQHLGGNCSGHIRINHNNCNRVFNYRPIITDTHSIFKTFEVWAKY